MVWSVFMILAKSQGKLGSLKNYLGLALSVRATISDSKSDFHKEFPYVIPPIYRKLADELLVELHLLSHQDNFIKTPVFAAGLKEIFNKFTIGYKPSEHIDQLFNAVCNCNGFNPEEINRMSEQLITQVNSIEKSKLNEYILTLKDENIEKSYYSRINAIGVYKLVSQLSYFKDLETKEVEEELSNISNLLGYSYSRVEKDISLYKSNIEKMKQALEILAQNITNK